MLSSKIVLTHVNENENKGLPIFLSLFTTLTFFNPHICLLLSSTDRTLPWGPPAN